jgi:ankyrin repeat protein
MIALVCPSCLRMLNIPEEYAGKKGKCNRCGSAITVTVEPAASAQVERVELSVTTFLRKNEQLLAASEQGDVAQVLELVRSGANINARDTYGVTPLHTAVCHGHAEVVQALVEHGAMVNAIEHNGCTPLHAAAARGFYEIARFLLLHGANVNVRDKDKDTPLHVAARATPSKPSALHMVSLLLAAGADIHARRNGGTTPLYEAGELGYPEVAEFLRQKGARE